MKSGANPQSGPGNTDPRSSARGGSAFALALRVLVTSGLVVAVLGGAIYAFSYLRATKPDVVRRPPSEREWTVTTAAVAFSDHRPELTTYGTATPARQVDLRALVSGEIVWVADELKEGGVVTAGAELLRIDPFDYEGALVEARANLAEARAGLSEIEAKVELEVDALEYARAQLEIAERDLERAEELVGRGAVSTQTVDARRQTVTERSDAVAQRENQADIDRARAVQQRAAIQRLEWRVRPGRAQPGAHDAGRALRRLCRQRQRRGRPPRRSQRRRCHADRFDQSRCPLRAHGRRVRPHRRRCRHGRRASGARHLECRRPAARVRGDGCARHPAGGRHARRHRGLRAAPGPGPARRQPGPAAGAFVAIAIEDRLYRDAARIPATALYGTSTVYVVRDERLDAREIVILGRAGSDLLVRGELSQGERILVSRITEIGEGLKVREAGQDAVLDTGEGAGTTAALKPEIH